MDMLYTYYCYVATQKHDAPTGVGTILMNLLFYTVYGIPGKFKELICKRVLLNGGKTWGFICESRGKALLIKAFNSVRK